MAAMMDPINRAFERRMIWRENDCLTLVHELMLAGGMFVPEDPFARWHAMSKREAMVESRMDMLTIIGEAIINHGGTYASIPFQVGDILFHKGCFRLRGNRQFFNHNGSFYSVYVGGRTKAVVWDTESLLPWIHLFEDPPDQVMGAYRCRPS